MRKKTRVRRFQNVKEGDLVYCTNYGDGIVTYIERDLVVFYPIEVEFENGYCDYDADGCCADTEERTLNYRTN